MNYLFINVTTLFDAFRSGTEEEYTELQQLLHDINSFKRDMEELKNKEKTKAKTGQRKGASFSKEGFLLKTTQKPYFFPYGKWLIFPVPHQTDPDSDVTPLPQRDRKKYPPNVKAAPRFTKHDDSQPSKQEHS